MNQSKVEMKHAQETAEFIELYRNATPEMQRKVRIILGIEADVSEPVAGTTEE